ISNLNDKLYEKRKVGALEVEELVKQLHAAKDIEGIQNIIRFLIITFSNSSNANPRKGGLIGLAAIGIALGPVRLSPPGARCRCPSRGGRRSHVFSKDFLLRSVVEYFRGIRLIGRCAQDVHSLLGLICPPVLKCFSDLDSRVRYYACESLYNIAKVSRSRILPIFNEIFDGLCKARQPLRCPHL